MGLVWPRILFFACVSDWAHRPYSPCSVLKCLRCMHHNCSFCTCVPNLYPTPTSKMLEIAGHLHRDETGETRNPNQASALHEKSTKTLNAEKLPNWFSLHLRLVIRCWFRSCVNKELSRFFFLDGFPWKEKLLCSLLTRTFYFRSSMHFQRWQDSGSMNWLSLSLSRL